MVRAGRVHHGSCVVRLRYLTTILPVLESTPTYQYMRPTRCPAGRVRIYATVPRSHGSRLQIRSCSKTGCRASFRLMHLCCKLHELQLTTNARVSEPKRKPFQMPLQAIGQCKIPCPGTSPSKGRSDGSLGADRISGSGSCGKNGT